MARKTAAGKKSTTAKNASSRESEPAPELPAATTGASAGLGVNVSERIPVSEYVVMARRYRPQQFHEVVGQEAVAEALQGAIAAGRVAHAYLFAGSRGVGKTSMARILAKALNCVEGPTPKPCDRCDVCQAIASGEDVDVLEIDGASNRGIDEIRQLRQNVHYRPSRTRYKVYIIDEVHMLTRDAFNALLKTLEEPPPHVKFIFCTTEPQRIPITILSRCQRFDFANISTAAIRERLRQIVEAEQVEAEPEALEVLARRASGSLRDSQSLLDQLLAFGGKRVTAQQVHQLLGTAPEERVVELGQHLLTGQAGAALSVLDSALAEGVQLEPLWDQLLEYFRDLMLLASGAGPAAGGQLLSFPLQWHDRWRESAVGGSSLGNVLAALQILIEAKSRMRGSTYARTLAELAFVRIATLEDLESLSNLIERLQTGGPVCGSAYGGSENPRSQAPGALSGSSGPAVTSPSAKVPKAEGGEPKAESGKPKAESGEPKAEGGEPKAESGKPKAESGEPKAESGGQLSALASMSAPSLSPLKEEALPLIWQQVLARCRGVLGDHASIADHVHLADPNCLVVGFAEKYNLHREYCARPDNRVCIETALKEVTGRELRVRFEGAIASPETSGDQRPLAGNDSPVQRWGDRSSGPRPAQWAQEPLVQKAIELFDATIVRVYEGPQGKS